MRGNALTSLKRRWCLRCLIVRLDIDIEREATETEVEEAKEGQR